MTNKTIKKIIMVVLVVVGIGALTGCSVKEESNSIQAVTIKPAE